MRKYIIGLILLAIAALYVYGNTPGWATNYYIDGTAGDSTKAGTSWATAWKSLSNINKVNIVGGDNVYTLGYFREQLTPKRDSTAAVCTWDGGGATVIDGSDFITSGWMRWHTVPDSSGLGRVVTNYGAVKTTINDGTKNYTGYDLATGYIDLGSDCVNTSEISFTANIYPRSTGTGGTGRIFSNGKFMVGVAASTNGKYRLFAGGDGTTTVYSADESITPNLWHRIVVKDSTDGKITFYINGALSGTRSQTGGTRAAGTNGFIGNRMALDMAADCVIDSVAMFDICLYDAQVDSLSTKGYIADLKQSSGSTVAYKLGALRAVGAEKVNHGTFDQYRPWWTMEAGWDSTTVAGIATATATLARIYASSPNVTVGKSSVYAFEWTRTAGRLDAYIGKSTPTTILSGASGISIGSRVPSENIVSFLGQTSAFTGTIDNVSVKETALSLFLPLDTQPSTPGSLFYASKYTTDNDSCYAMWGHADSLMTRKMAPSLLTAPNQWSNLMNGGYGYPTPRSLTAAGNTNDYRLVYAPADTIQAMKSNRYTVNCTKDNVWLTGFRGTKGMALQSSSIYSTGANTKVYSVTCDSSGYEGIYLNGASSSAYNNTVYNNTYGIYLNGTSSSAYNNTTYNNTYGILLNGTSSSAYNNTVYNNNTYGIYLVSVLGGYIVKNNIVSMSSTSFIVIPASATTPNVFSNNLYYTTGAYTNKWVIGTTNYSTLTSWQAATGQDANSIVGNPLLDVNGKPRAVSLMNHGANLYGAGVTTDITGRKRPTSAAFTIGAYQLTGRKQWGEISNEISNEIRAELRAW